MKKWMLALPAGVLAAVVVAVVIGTTAGASTTASPSAAASATPGPRSSVRPEGQWQQLMKDKAFRDEYFALRRAQLDDEQAWWDKYASDPQGDAAQTAWRQLRQKEQSGMQALLKKYGVTLPAPPEDLRQLQKLRDNTQFRSDGLKLAGKFRADMQAWFKTYGSDPRSSKAQAAMDTLRTTYESELKALLKKYGVTISGDLPFGILGRGLMGGGLGMGFGMGPGMGDGMGPGMGFGHGSGAGPAGSMMGGSPASQSLPPF